MNVFIIVMRFFLQLCIAIWNGLVSGINAIMRLINKKIIERNNSIKRGVIEDKRVRVDTIYINGFMHNSIVSGGEQHLRSVLLQNAVENYSGQGMPIIIIHQSDRQIENYLASSISNPIIINSINNIFDPFINRSTDEIIKIVMDSKKEYGFTEKARVALKGILKFAQLNSSPIQLPFLNNCPYGSLFEKVDTLENNGTISSAVADDIKYLLSRGQEEFDKLDAYFFDLSNESDAIISKRKGIGYDMIKAVTNGSVISIDIGSNANHLLLSVIVSQINILLKNRRYFTLVLDEITIENNPSLIQLLSSVYDNCHVAIISSDLFASVNGNDKLMYTLLGNSYENIVMQHGSNVSADIWSKAIGYYEKIETSTNSSNGKSRGGLSLFPAYNSNDGINYSKKQEAIVKPEQILRMRINEMYVYDKESNTISHKIIS
jgi:hypothetical protein